jgi:quinol monooxygenase YgiN
MSLPVLIGFAGVLVAAAATGMLAGRCVRQPRIAFIAWAAATLALTVALAAQSMGFASGFGQATFRAVQLFGLLLAPLWLAWGLAELAWQSEAARFGARLASSALTVVGGVILATDPLAAQPFGKSWPLVGQHYQPFSHYALDVVQSAAVVTAVASTGLAAVRARNDRQWAGALGGIAPASLAVLMIAALRFSLPARSLYPLLTMMAAALVWFGATRIEDQPGHPGRDDAGRDRAGRDDAGRDRAGRDRAGRDRAGRDDRGREAGGYYVADARDPTSGHRRPKDLKGLNDLKELQGSQGSFDPIGSDGSRWPSEPGVPRGPVEPRGPRGPGLPRGPVGSPLWRDRYPGSTVAAAALAGAGARSGPLARPAGSPAASPARPYGRILIFTLLDDRAADFDRLAEQTAEQIRIAEPDTVVYVIHLVPNAPMQRIFYEIYRDRAAFDSHESQPYMKRFVTERRSCVLATNVIELRLKYAKVAPLPNPQPASLAAQPASPAAQPASPAAQLGARAKLPPGLAARPQALEPLPPGPDRRLPSAGRRYGGI